MGKIVAFSFAIAVILGSSIQANAALSNRGTDSFGNRLIYDDDLNITWYDYTKSADFWQNQMDWAASLSVDFGGTIYDNWRLPTTVDGPDGWGRGYDGMTPAGWNITTSEMGHLYYTELGNLGYFDTSGNYQPGWGLINTGDFQNLEQRTGYDGYWSGTEYADTPGLAWHFCTGQGWEDSCDPGAGYQGIYDKEYNHLFSAIAVRPGDVSVAPEPISSILFILGGTILGFRHVVRKKLNRIFQLAILNT